MNAPAAARADAPAAPRTLVAGVGNVFLGDDGFGVETVRRLIAAGPLPEQVEVVDFGVRGVHLAYQLLDGYDTFILVDATARGGAPGTVYLIEAGVPGDGTAAQDAPERALMDGHRMSPDTVLALLGTLCAGTGGTPPRRTLVVGCEPAGVEEGMGLSEPVEAAVPEAVDLLLSVLGRAGWSTDPPQAARDRADRPAHDPPRDSARARRGGSRDRSGIQGAIEERNTTPC